MYGNLKALGIVNPERIERYTLRQEATTDILKIYYLKGKGDFFAKSVKFKFPRQRKTILVDGGTNDYREVSEISPELRHIVAELDQLATSEHQGQDIKQKILADLRHLEKVVANKIAEIENDLEQL